MDSFDSSLSNAKQRIRVTAKGPLLGKTGEVWRLCRDGSAWITMDDDLPEGLGIFPVNDPHGRGKHIRLYPEHCEPA